MTSSPPLPYPTPVATDLRRFAGLGALLLLLLLLLLGLAGSGRPRPSPALAAHPTVNVRGWHFADEEGE